MFVSIHKGGLAGLVWLLSCCLLDVDSDAVPRCRESSIPLSNGCRLRHVHIGTLDCTVIKVVESYPSSRRPEITSNIFLRKSNRPNEQQDINHQTIQTTGTKTYPLLSELTSALVLSVSQEFDDTALIGGKTDNLAGDLADEGSAAGRLALGAADLGLGGVEGGGFL